MIIESLKGLGRQLWGKQRDRNLHALRLAHFEGDATRVGKYINQGAKKAAVDACKKDLEVVQIEIESLEVAIAMCTEELAALPAEGEDEDGAAAAAGPGHDGIGDGEPA